MTHTSGRRVIALCLAASGAAATVLLWGAGPSYAQAPAVVAWWNAANRGGPAPAPPAPPDVKPGDLLVQGSNAVSVGTPLQAAPASSLAIAGLSFDVAPTDRIGALTLTADGTPPSQVSVTVCAATAPFTAADGGPWSRVPPYDANRCLPGILDGHSVTFNGMSGLVSGHRLSVVVLPGPLDRVVFARPTRTALHAQHGSSAGPVLPPIGAGHDPGDQGSPGGRITTPSTQPVGSTVGVPIPIGGQPGTLPASAGGSEVPPPAVAGADPTTGAASTQQTEAAVTSPEHVTRWRRAIALSIIALEVAGCALLVRSSKRAGTDAPPTAMAGVGRFRRQRHGPAPQL